MYLRCGCGQTLFVDADNDGIVKMKVPHKNTSANIAPKYGASKLFK
jgi:hypothetical protein